MKKAQLISTLLLCAVNATAALGSADQVPAFKARAQSKCGDLQVENVIDWARGKDSANHLDEKIGEVRNQGDVGWCYAYTARDLIHHHKGVAPDLGYLVKGYYSSFVGGFFDLFSMKNKGEGGFTSTTLKVSMKYGICPEYASSDANPTPDTYKDVVCLDKPQSYSKRDELVIRRSTHGGRGHPLFRELDKALSKGKMVGVSYNANGLYQEEFRTGNFITKTLSNHASSIVGRYFNTESGTCNYLIRNSWGQGTQYILKGPQIDGYHSITEEDLSESLTEVVYFK